jgi:hypothetical protein
MPRPGTGAAERTLADIVIGAVQSTRARDARDREMGLSELEEQFQLVLEPATATTTIAWASTVVEFECKFHYAPGQRDSELDRPQFWFGAAVSPAVLVTAVVTDWTIETSTGAIVGATVAIGALADSVTPYEGVVHLTFQGYGALIEESPNVDLEA